MTNTCTVFTQHFKFLTPLFSILRENSTMCSCLRYSFCCFILLYIHMFYNTLFHLLYFLISIIHDAAIRFRRNFEEFFKITTEPEYHTNMTRGIDNNTSGLNNTSKPPSSKKKIEKVPQKHFYNGLPWQFLL